MSIIKIQVLSIIISILASFPAAADGSRTWRYYYTRGVLQFNAEMYDYSLLSMRKALDMKPDLFKAANYIADIYAIKQNKLQSFQYLEISLAINPRQADTHNKIGDLYEFYEDHDEALRHYAESVALQPDHLMANINLVRHYIRLKQPDRAMMYFNAGYLAGKAAARGLYGPAEEADRKGEIDTAARLYGKIIAANPAEISAYRRLFEIHRSRGEYEKAARIMERLVFLKPDYEPGMVKLGYLYYTDPLPGKKDRRLWRAMEYFSRAITLNPSNPESYFTLAEIYRYAGREEDAVKVERSLKALLEKK